MEALGYDTTQHKGRNDVGELVVWRSEEEGVYSYGYIVGLGWYGGNDEATGEGSGSGQYYAIILACPGCEICDRPQLDPNQPISVVHEGAFLDPPKYLPRTKLSLGLSPFHGDFPATVFSVEYDSDYQGYVYRIWGDDGPKISDIDLEDAVIRIVEV